MVDFINIHEVLSHLDLKKSDSAAEFGCGTADFALALAKKLDKGKVYALDIQQEKLLVLKNKMALQGVHNIKTIVCDLEAPNGSTLKSNFLDAVLIPNVLFQVENKYAIMEEAKRVLKIGGQLLLTDWLKAGIFNSKDLPASATPKALQAGSLVSPEEVKKIANTLGLSLKKEFAAGDYHYTLLFIK